MAAGQLTPKQAFERRNLPYIYFGLRPLGRACLPFAAKLGVTPNQVTLASVLISLVGIGLLATGGLTLSLIGLAVLHGGLVLDMVDGDLARLTGKASIRGEFADALGGYIRGGLMFPAIGISVARVMDRGHELITDVFDYSPDVYFQVGVWIGLLYFASRLITLRYRTLLGGSVRQSAGRLGRLSLNFEDMLLPLLIVAAATRTMSLVLLLYGLYYLASGLYTILVVSVRSPSGKSEV